jgi:hypothetical protein
MLVVPPICRRAAGQRQDSRTDLQKLGRLFAEQRYGDLLKRVGRASRTPEAAALDDGGGGRAQTRGLRAVACFERPRALSGPEGGGDQPRIRVREVDRLDDALSTSPRISGPVPVGAGCAPRRRARDARPRRLGRGGRVQDAAGIAPADGRPVCGSASSSSSRASTRAIAAFSAVLDRDEAPSRGVRARRAHAPRPRAEGEARPSATG